MPKEEHDREFDASEAGLVRIFLREQKRRTEGWKNERVKGQKEEKQKGREKWAELVTREMNEARMDSLREAFFPLRELRIVMYGQPRGNEQILI